MNTEPDNLSSDLESTTCPLCQGAQTARWAVTRDYNWRFPGRFTYHRCGACGLVYENPRPTAMAMSGFYPAQYGTTAGDGTALEPLINLSAHARRAQALERFCPPGQALDVGCGAGFFPAYLQRRGWRVSGLEPAAEHVRFARERLGLTDIRIGHWPLDQPLTESFDAISLIHVLEHMPRLRESLHMAREGLRTDGWLLIETPNVTSWPARLFRGRWATLDAPRHVCLFSANTLRRCLLENGFTPMRIDTYSPSTLEYVESLRYLLNDMGLRHRSEERAPGGALPSGPAASPAAHPPSLKLGRTSPPSAWLRGLHAGERAIWRGHNRISDHVGNGCNLLAIARKAEG